MRSSNPDLVLVPLLVPVIALGLAPLVILPLVGPIGIAVLGLLICSGAVMSELEEKGAHARQVIAHGSLPASEQAGYRCELAALKRSGTAMKIIGVALMAIGLGGIFLQ